MATTGGAGAHVPTFAPDALFEHLYRSHYASVRAYAAACVPASDVDDVVSESFLVAWRRRTDIPADWPRGWLIGVTRNIVRGRRRSNRRASDFVERLALDRPMVPDGPADIQATAERVAALRSAMSRLKASDQEILVFAGPLEMTHDEIALALDITVNAVGVRVHRARQRLRHAYADQINEGGEAA